MNEEKEIYYFDNGSVLNLSGLTLWYRKVDGMFAQVYSVDNPDDMGLIACWEKAELIKSNVTHEQFKKEYGHGQKEL